MSASTDRFAAARAVADAVVYEGYLLYPYRASARKNQVRWQFGVVVPPACAALDPSERSAVRTECVVDPGQAPRLHVSLRGLQVQHRCVEAAVPGGFEPVDELAVEGTPWVAFDEAIDHDVPVAELSVLPVAEARREVPVSLPARRDVEELHAAGGAIAGRLVRTASGVELRVRVEARWADGPGAYVAVAVVVENVTPWSSPDAPRDEVVRRSLVGVHVLLAIDDGRFVSLLEPPDAAAAAVAGCRNDGLFPVLVGPDDDCVLASPIILYDQPAVAPESAGDLFDATEIDEILALRVLTMTDDEKAQARGTDRRAAAIVERCDNLPPDVWARLHGAIRSLAPVVDDAPATVAWWDPDAEAAVDPWSEVVDVGGVDVHAGTSVVLRPGNRRADAHDLFLAGMAATVAGVFRDAEGEVHLAVTVDDDPATELLAGQGRYLFFRPDEVEPAGRRAP